MQITYDAEIKPPAKIRANGSRRREDADDAPIWTRMWHCPEKLAGVRGAGADVSS
jgi:hypothetical protein